MIGPRFSSESRPVTWRAVRRERAGMTADPVRTICLVACLLTACASAPTLKTDVDTVPVPSAPHVEKCVDAADVPALPSSREPATGSMKQKAAAASLDARAYRDAAGRAIDLLQRCAQ